MREQLRLLEMKLQKVKERQKAVEEVVESMQMVLNGEAKIMELYNAQGKKERFLVKFVMKPLPPESDS